jgi:hypothetical protein
MKRKIPKKKKWKRKGKYECEETKNGKEKEKITERKTEKEKDIEGRN